jgi:hypothetical protein
LDEEVCNTLIRTNRISKKNFPNRRFRRETDDGSEFLDDEIEKPFKRMSNRVFRRVTGNVEENQREDVDETTEEDLLKIKGEEDKYQVNIKMNEPQQEFVNGEFDIMFPAF